MEFKGTKQDWQREDNTVYALHYRQDGSVSNRFWFSISPDPTSQNAKLEVDANAQLAATAPELLENLQRIIDRIEESNYQDHFPSAYRRATEAINKAIDINTLK